MSIGGGGAALGSAYGDIIIRVDQAEQNLKRLQGQISAFGDNSTKTFERIATGVGLLAFGKKTFDLFGGSISDARNFEQAIANVNAVTELTGDQLDKVREKALQLGADSVFSATEAAAAMEELAKAGVSVEDILNGAADGAVALAASAGIGLPQAATIVATAMNIYGLAGDQATHVADVFSAAANKSAADADGLAQSLQQVGLVAASNNISLEETTGILALLADNGLKGSDAGTSLKTAITNLLTPMGRGAEVMEQYGINVRDANGEFIGFAATADELHRALDPLPKAQRDAALAAIFGTDAIRVGNVLYGEGADKINEYTAAVDDSGAASETAAKRLDTFSGSVEQLRGAIESASIVIGTALLPALKEVVQGATAAVQAFIDLPGPIQATLAGLVGASGAIAAIAGGMVLAGPKAAAFGDALKTIRVALLGTNPLLLAAAAAVALFGLAYVKNFGGFADTVDAVLNKAREFARVFARSFSFSRSLPDIGNAGAAFAALGQAMTEVLGINVYKQFRAIGDIADRIGKSLNRIGRQFGILGRVIKRGGLADGIDQLFGKIGQNLLAEFGDVIGALPRTIGTALRQITTGFDPVDRALKNLGSAFQQFGRFVENVFAGNFDTALANLRNMVKRLHAGALDISGVVVRIASWAFETAVDLGSAIATFVTDDLWPQVKSAATDIADAAVSVTSWVVSAGVDLGAAVSGWITGTAWPAVKSTAIAISDVLLSIGSFTISAATGIWEAVSGAVSAAWELIKNIAVEIPDALLAVVGFVVSLGDSVWGAVGHAILTAWEAVKDTAISIKDVALSVVNWVTDQIEAGTLIDSVQAFVEDQLATLNVTINDWKLTVGAPDEGGITVDVGAIWDKIWNDIINPTFTPEQTKAAEDAGSNIGAKAVDLIMAGIKAAFGIGQKISGGDGTGEDQLTGKDIVAAFITGLFKGAFGEALGIGADLSEQARTWASNTRDAIFKAISDVFTGATKLELGPGGDFAGATVVDQPGIFDGLISLFTTNPLEGISFPDLVTPVRTWVSNQLDSIRNSLTSQIPDWMQKLASGDLLGAIKALFGGGGKSNDGSLTGGGGQRNDITAPDFNPFPNGQPFIEPGTIFPTEFNQKSEDFRGALGDAGTAVTTFAATVQAQQRSISTALANMARDGLAQTQQFAAGVNQGMQFAVTAAGQGAQRIRAAAQSIGSLGGIGFSVGQSLGFGIAGGIASTVGAVTQAVANIINAARQTAIILAQIHSPSRLFANDVGLPIAQGIGAGIAAGSPYAQRSMSDLIGGLVPGSGVGRMLGSQPMAQATAGVTYITNVYPLKSDEYEQIIRNGQRGAEAHAFVGQLTSSAPERLGSTRGRFR